LAEKDEQLTDKSNVSLSQHIPPGYDGLSKMAHVRKSATQEGRDIKFAKPECPLLTSQLASSLSENRLLSAPCLTSSSTLQMQSFSLGKRQLSHRQTVGVSQNQQAGSDDDDDDSSFDSSAQSYCTSRLPTASLQMQSFSLGKRQLSHRQTVGVSQKMSLLGTAPSSLPSTTMREHLAATPCAAMTPSSPTTITDTTLEYKSIKTQKDIKRKVCDTKRTSGAGKTKAAVKPMQKVKLTVPQQAGSDDDDEDDSSFDLPIYWLPPEHPDSEKVELFISPEKEEVLEQAMRPIVDVPGVKVIMSL